MGRRPTGAAGALVCVGLLVACASGHNPSSRAKADRGRGAVGDSAGENGSGAVAADTQLASEPAKTGDREAGAAADIVHPCESVCGRVGDCLLADPNEPRGSASKLEMACIGMCLDGGESHQSKLSACSRDGDSCGDYLSCVGANWSTRVRPAAKVVRSREMQCADVCDLGDCFLEMWMSAGAHLDPAELDQQRRAYEQFVEQACVQGCVENASDADIEVAERCNAMSCSERLQCVMSKDFIVL